MFCTRRRLKSRRNPDSLSRKQWPYSQLIQKLPISSNIPLLQNIYEQQQLFSRKSHFIYITTFCCVSRQWCSTTAFFSSTKIGASISDARRSIVADRFFRRWLREGQQRGEKWQQSRPGSLGKRDMETCRDGKR